MLCTWNRPLLSCNNGNTNAQWYALCRIPVPDGEVMISELGPDWQGLAGLTGIVESVGAVQLSVPAAADLLLQADPSI